ncbi:MAG TPA: hypothetical protein VF634_11340, partial [Pyrinomonadaceae bacterium]
AGRELEVGLDGSSYGQPEKFARSFFFVRAKTAKRNSTLAPRAINGKPVIASLPQSKFRRDGTDSHIRYKIRACRQTIFVFLCAFAPLRELIPEQA